MTDELVILSKDAFEKMPTAHIVASRRPSPLAQGRQLVRMLCDRELADIAIMPVRGVFNVCPECEKVRDGR